MDSSDRVSANSKSRRRKIGTACIAIAILMLIAGETVLKNKLSGIPMLCYWLGCFVFTAIAAGAVAPDIGKQIIDAIAALSNVRANEDLEQRIIQLEAKAI